MCGRSILCEIRNDIRKKGTVAKYNLDALDFLRSRTSSSAEGILYDPPYNDAQGKLYTKGMRSRSDVKYWAALKREMYRVLKPNSQFVQLGWNSNALNAAMTIQRIVIFAHGSDRPDTILSIQQKSG